jgi:hypothetical protein
VDARITSKAVRLSGSGCIFYVPKQPKVVMPGLVSGIHGMPQVQNPEFGAG